ncbi:DEAD-box ATP-dependent RNA helicase CshA [Fimbriiglobus ruber]|uniref:DEAD-box ATP-dependent RNA helicase CshA n=1 Tax=Fimbriiglobus ruber TaxID=1908690 RepID=A0A225E407_9BACT|nr:DEAD-box ATP-dependent RNA helicase CshA [Fimbriiglobus ruber]
MASLTSFGYIEPTPIQREAIPPLLNGSDLVGLAATGTGKTAAFALPIIHRIAAAGATRARPSTIILVPTRELAIQVSAAVTRYGRPLGVSSLAIYGGTGFNDQVRALRRGVDIVVATPGRALDHVRRETIVLTGITAAVLDEADEMLDMGFAEDIEAILSATPDTRQTMLFSATMPPRIAGIAQRHLKNPVRVEVARTVLAAGEAPKVRQTAYLVPRGFKAAVLSRVLELENPTSAIIFCRTRTEADGLTDTLTDRGFRPESLHGGLSQEQRDRVMGKFRAGTVNLLIATDVAARGLDIGHLSHVVNLHAPEAVESYVHRIGRVGRAGREGVAITLVEPREQFQLRQIERSTKQPITLARVPSSADLRAKRLERTRDAVRELIATGGLEEFHPAVGELAAEFGPLDVACASMKLALQAGRSGAEDEENIPVIEPGPKAPSRDGGKFARPAGAPGVGGPPVRPFDRDRGRAAVATKGMSRIFISVGREAGVSPRDIVGAIANEAGLGKKDIGSIEITERFTLVEVLDELADDVIEVLQGGRIRGRKIVVRRDRVN